MKSKHPPIHVLLVDDHPVIRQGLAGLLEDEGFVVVGMAGNTSETLKILSEQSVDVTVVDLTLENESGLDVLTSIRQSAPKVTAVVYSVHEDVVHVRKALQAGAIGYISKREDPEVLVECLKTIRSGERFLSPRAARALADAMASGQEVMPEQVLSQQEMQVYALLGKGLGTPDIADKMNLSSRTVETYYNRIVFKLGLPGRREMRRHAVEYARLAVNS